MKIFIAACATLLVSLPAFADEVIVPGKDRINASLTGHLGYDLALLMKDKVLTTEFPLLLSEAREPVTLASTDETSARTLVSEGGMGGIYYASEEDVARDAILIADPEYSPEDE